MWKVVALLTVIVQPVLTLTTIEYTNHPVCQWVEADPQVGGTGGGHFEETTYTGTAFVLSAEALIDGRWVVEYSTDLANWLPYPSAGCMLTLTPTNTTGVIFIGNERAFFRVRNLPW